MADRHVAPQVRPTFLETSLRQKPWGSSPKDHLLSSYREALMAVMLAQLDKDKVCCSDLQMGKYLFHLFWHGALC